MPVTYAVPHRESRPLNEPLQWPQMESAAIQQWRDITTASPRRNGQPRLEHHENQPPQGTDTRLSGEDSASPGKKPRDISTYPKYLVRDYLRLHRAMPPVKENGGDKIPSKDSFIPSPKITFLIDSPTNLTCQICQQAPLEMVISAKDPNRGMMAILPCGHICCHGCIDFWLQNHESCPFCRTNMTHPDCGHQVQPRLIAQDTIHTLPETLANGGTIGDMCWKCTEKHTRHRSVQRLTKLAERFKIARREVADMGTKEAIEEMRRAQEAFESFPGDDFLTLSRIRHHQW